MPQTSFLTEQKGQLLILKEELEKCMTIMIKLIENYDVDFVFNFQKCKKKKKKK